MATVGVREHSRRRSPAVGSRSTAELTHGRVECGEQVDPAVKPAAGDKGKGFSRLVERRGIGASQQGRDVHAVVRARAIVSCQHLQRDKMTKASDRHGETGDDLDWFRRGHDLGLDSGRGEEQIDDRAAGDQ